MVRGLPQLELFCFGSPTARLGGREAPRTLLWSKHLGLLIYLALAPERRRMRDHLLGVFWPEMPQENARHALNETLRRLRQLVGAGRLVSQGDAIVMSGEGLEVDVWRDHAVADATAPFLDGFSVDGAAETFEKWVAAQRRTYTDRTVEAAVAAGEQQLADSRFTAAVESAQRALAIERFCEPAERILLHATALAGDATGALAKFRQFAAEFKQETGDEPSRALTKLGELIRSGEWRRAPSPKEDPEPPLIGREQVHREAFTLVATAMADGPRTLLIRGATGMGRTRLLTECVERLKLDGALLLRVRPLPTDHDAPWSTLRLLARSLAQAPGHVAAPPVALELLAGLAPELEDRFEPQVPPDSGAAAGAIAAVLKAVVGEQPIVLAIEDAQLSDAASLEVLSDVVERLPRRTPLAFIVTIADEATPSAAVLRLRKEVGERQRLRGVAVRLDPLTLSDMRQLVSALAPWCEGEEARDRLARRMESDTSGNPFHAVILLGGLRRLANHRADFAVWPRPNATHDTPLPITIPELVLAAVEARVKELDPEPRTVLIAASIGGVSLDVDLIAALTELPRAQVEARLGKLEDHQFIVLDGRRYAFTSPLIKDTVRSACLKPGQRQAMRQRAAKALEDRKDLESRVLRVELLARTDPGAVTVKEALEVQREAEAAGSTRTARRAAAAVERARR